MCEWFEDTAVKTGTFHARDLEKVEIAAKEEVEEEEVEETGEEEDLDFDDEDFDF